MDDDYIIDHAFNLICKILIMTRYTMYCIDDTDLQTLALQYVHCLRRFIILTHACIRPVYKSSTSSSPAPVQTSKPAQNSATRFGR